MDFECVLANTIVNVNATSHPDLYFALQGSRNQYAVVTKITLKTYNSASGAKCGAAPGSTAVANFTANNEDPKAAIIPAFNFVGAVGLDVPAIIVFYYYDGPTTREVAYLTS